MKIAIAKQGESVSAHFGHCDGFEVFEVESAEVATRNFVANPGHTPGFLPKFLAEAGVEVIIAGGMGAMAQNLFKEQEIAVIISNQETVTSAIDKYLEGTLKSTDSVCDHHSNADSCGGH